MKITDVVVSYYSTDFNGHKHKTWSRTSSIHFSHNSLSQRSKKAAWKGHMQTAIILIFTFYYISVKKFFRWAVGRRSEFGCSQLCECIENITVTQLLSEPSCCGHVHGSQLSRAIVLAIAVSHDLPGCFSVGGVGPCQKSLSQVGDEMAWAGHVSLHLETADSRQSGLCSEESLATGMQAYFLLE